jgi:dihydrofolate reductase
MRLSLIAALTPDRVLGDGKKLLWHIPADLKFFKQTTLGHPIIMGRATFDSVGKPLPGRKNIVITRDPHPTPIPGIHWANTLDDAITAAGETDEIFICGGGAIYTLALPRADRLYLTWIVLDRPITGTVHFPTFDPAAWKIVSNRTQPADGPDPGTIQFVTYDRIR